MQIQDVESPGGPIHVQNHVVLFVDLLNQQAAIKELEKLPENNSEYPTYIKALKNSAGKVVGLRKFVDNFIKGHLTAPHLSISGLSAEQQSAFRTTRDVTVKSQRFMDTVLMYSPLGNADGNGRPSSVYAILGGAASFLIACFAGKAAIRGGVDLKPALELSECDLYGPACVGAYRLESETADWPRIVVSDNVVEYLDLLLGDQRDNWTVKFNREIAKQCRSLVQKDIHGVWFIDFLGKTNRDLASNDPEIYDAVFAGFDWVKAERSRFEKLAAHTNDGIEQAKLKKLARRYTLLQEYYEKRTPYWRKP